MQLPEGYLSEERRGQALHPGQAEQLLRELRQLSERVLLRKSPLSTDSPQLRVPRRRAALRAELRNGESRARGISVLPTTRLESRGDGGDVVAPCEGIERSPKHERGSDVTDDPSRNALESPK